MLPLEFMQEVFQIGGGGSGGLAVLVDRLLELLAQDADVIRGQSMPSLTRSGADSIIFTSMSSPMSSDSPGLLVSTSIQRTPFPPTSGYLTGQSPSRTT